MKLDSAIEDKIRERVIKYLEIGRAGWDLPHTMASVFWMRSLLKEEKGDERILIPTMYLHDVGYSEVLGQKNGEPGVSKLDNKEHMSKGVAIARKLLEDLPFTDQEKKEILHLISMHDDLDMISSENEILVFESDSLAQIDLERVKPTFSYDDRRRFLVVYDQKRVPRFKTASGKRFLADLLGKAKKFYNLQ